MIRAAVESSNIKSIGYDASTKVLEVEFKNRKEGAKTPLTYQYANVPASEHRDFMNADSKGSYFARNIKGKYDLVPKPES